MLICQEEIFGPVLAVIFYDDVDEASASDYGLDGNRWSANVDRALKVASEMDTGMVRVDGFSSHTTAWCARRKTTGLGPEGPGEYLALQSADLPD